MHEKLASLYDEMISEQDLRKGATADSSKAKARYMERLKSRSPP
jgi:hypothetical protein